ncbi:MAG: glycosyltransferase [Cytophagales bacterium]|nr:glycosyltransferase [Cytophagales bacterium]
MINLFFVVHDYSGARTYANELFNHFFGHPGIAIHKVYLESNEYREYTEIKEKDVLSIHIPRIKRKGGTLEKYAARCADLMAPRLRSAGNIIFHLNYSTQVKLGIEVRKRYDALLVYTMHYLPTYFTYLAFEACIPDKIKTTGDALDKEILKEVDKIVCISKFAQHTICNRYSTLPAKTEVIYNGYGTIECKSPANVTRTKQSFGFGKDERFILFAGRLSAEKGVYVLVSAFKKIAEEFPDARLVLAGEGDFNEVMKRCRSIVGKVTFTGTLQKEQLQKLYSLVDIGVVPSHFELLGYVPIEMMLHRIPVVISNVPGMNELVEDGKNGLLCKVKKRTDGLLGLEADSTDLYLKIKSLLENKHLATRIAQNGRLSWENGFTAYHMGRATVHLYRQLLKQKKRSSSDQAI